MGDFFNSIQKRAAARGVSLESKESLDWFRKNIKELANGATAQQLIDGKEGKFKAWPPIGSLSLWVYDAKHKDKLPYWDMFPLSIVVNHYDDGWLGLNLHYLSPKMRLQIMDPLFDLTATNKMDEKTRFRVTYKLVKNYSQLKLLKPTIHRYLKGHVRSKILTIEPKNWAPAIFMPLAKFQGASNSKVWSDSKVSIFD